MSSKFDGIKLTPSLEAQLARWRKKLIKDIEETMKEAGISEADSMGLFLSYLRTSLVVREKK